MPSQFINPMSIQDIIALQQMEEIEKLGIKNPVWERKKVESDEDEATVETEEEKTTKKDEL